MTISTLLLALKSGERCRFNTRVRVHVLLATIRPYTEDLSLKISIANYLRSLSRKTLRFTQIHQNYLGGVARSMHVTSWKSPVLKNQS